VKTFQSRVVAAWIVALPIASVMIVSANHRITRLKTNPQLEVADELRRTQHVSFVSFFLITFVFLVVAAVVIDALANIIRQLFPERPQEQKPAV
jgi:hypothetical protein